MGGLEQFLLQSFPLFPTHTPSPPTHPPPHPYRVLVGLFVLRSVARVAERLVTTELAEERLLSRVGPGGEQLS